MASALYLENFLESKPVLVFSVVSVTSLSPSLSRLFPSSRYRESSDGAAEELYSHAIPRPASTGYGSSTYVCPVRAALRYVTISVDSWWYSPASREMQSVMQTFISTLCRVRWRVVRVLLDQEAWAARVDLFPPCTNA